MPKLFRGKRPPHSIVGIQFLIALLLTLGVVLGNLPTFSVAASSGKSEPSNSETSTLQTIPVKQSQIGTTGCQSADTMLWHFIINQIDTPSDAPGSITVTFQQAGTKTVNLYTVTNGGTAHYIVQTGPGDTLLNATAQIYKDWSGQFNLSHTTCVKFSYKIADLQRLERAVQPEPYDLREI